MDTLRQVAGVVQAHCTLAPYLLVEQWCIDAYRQAAHRRPWSHLFVQAELLTSASRSGTCTITRGSRVVDGVVLTFTQADRWRQLRLDAGGTPYTILGVDTVTNTATLDRVVAVASGTVTGTILDAYAILPEDFGRFIAVMDPAEGYQIRWWLQQEELNTYCPRRDSSGVPTAMSFLKVSEDEGIEGRNIYEWYPWPTTQRYYPYLYMKDVGRLSTDDALRGPFRNRGDIIRYGALSEAAMWPGDADKKNGFFNPAASKAYKDRFETELARLEVVDEDVATSWFEAVSWLSRPYFPMDARFAQSHDVPLMLEGFI